ncbi:MAG: SDR family NAD(P)-dependent oxidoreductase, partial [bacterium]
MSEFAGIAGRRVLITGATSGLGLAMAQALIREGAYVVIGGRDQSKIDQVVASLKPGVGKYAGMLMDVRDERSIQEGV